MKKIYGWILCLTAVILILLGVTLRLTETLSGNYVFGFDQGLDFLAARSIVVDHKLTLIGSEAGAGFAGLPGIFHGPGYRYILAVLLFISSGDPHGSIIFLGLLSLAVLAALFYLSHSVMGRTSAWVALTLAAISLPLTAQARMVWAPNFSGVIAIPLLYMLWMSQKKKPLYIFLTALFAAGLYHFEIPMAVPAIVAVGAYFAFTAKVRGLKEWGLFMLGILVGFLPMILFESRHGWGVVKGIFAYLNRTGVAATSAPFRPVAELVGDTNALFSTIRESFYLGIPWISGMLPWLLLGSACFYVYHEKKKETKLFITALLCIIVSHLLIFYLYRGPIYSHYFSLLYFIYPLLGAYVVGKAMKQTMTRAVVFVLGIILVTAVSVKIAKTIRYDYADYGGTAKKAGKIDAIDSIYSHAAGTGFNLFVFTPPVVPYAYDYLIGWYAAKRYGYTPGHELAGTVYLLIEPDPEKPWSYNGWLETVIKKGDVVAQWKLPSGFLIEKRFIKEDK